MNVQEEEYVTLFLEGDFVQFADDPIYVNVKRVVETKGKKVKVIYNIPKTTSQTYVNSVGGMWIDSEDLFLV